MKYVSRNLRCKYDKSEMQEAIELVIQQNVSISEAAKVKNVPRKTLSDRVKRFKKDQKVVKLGGPTIFTEDQELAISNHCLKLASVGFGLTIKDLRKLAYKFSIILKTKESFNSSKEMAGWDWCRSFLQRHREISIRKPEPLSYLRARGMNYITIFPTQRIYST